MAAIARRLFLALFAYTPAEEWRELLADLAANLSAGNVSACLRLFARDFPHREALRDSLASLTAAYDLSSSVEVRTGDADRLEVDWYLSGRSKTGNAVAFQRREILTLSLTRAGKFWRISRLEPLTFFQP
jgi:hypothetical protein